MHEFRKFSSIVQFNNVVTRVRYNSKHTGTALPTLEFKGTVKVHGTNACISYSNQGMVLQSREQVLGDSGHFGFVEWVNSNKTIICTGLQKLLDAFNAKTVYLYGEWFGKGVQKKVGVSNLQSKYFGAFNIVVADSTGQESAVEVSAIKQFLQLDNLVVLEDFGTYSIVIDFSNPKLSQNDLAKMTLEVEESCPVAKGLGASGIGEGIVWECTTQPLPLFKVKGDEHSNSTVKTLRELAPAEIEYLNSINEFLDFALAEWRLEQGVQYLVENNYPVDTVSTKQFIDWVVQDVYKECSEQLVKVNLNPKDVNKHLGPRAAKWLRNKI